MISKILSNFKLKFISAKNVKGNIFRIVKTKSSLLFIAVGGTASIFTYLYNNDGDYLVDEFPHNLPVTMYRVLPLCQLSRVFGNLANKEIPEVLRGAVLGSYVRLTGCDLSEAKITDVREYKSLSELFRRQLKWDSRTIDRDSDMVSPCDGTVLYCGEATNDTIEQVKGVNFTLGGFLGKDYAKWRSKTNKPQQQQEENKHLFFVTLYLAPGDYHRFHSPSDCDLVYRRYFSGKLLSVNPWLARVVPGLFSVNERVVYFGQWKHGLLTFTAVGATNVGNIRVFADRELPTNHQQDEDDSEEKPYCCEKSLQPMVKLSRGQLFGEFNLGSTIVLIFEAPKDFQFSVKPREKIKMGVSLGKIIDKQPNSIDKYNNQ